VKVHRYSDDLEQIAILESGESRNPTERLNEAVADLLPYSHRRQYHLHLR
jgi:hypothetical protein